MAVTRKKGVTPAAAGKRDSWERKHLRNIAGYESQVDRLYREAVRQAVALAASLPEGALDPDKLFSFDDFPQLRERVNALFNGVRSDLKGVIVNGVESEWTLANNKNNELARVVFGDAIGKLSQAAYRRYFNSNDAAREAFLSRKEAGLNLSDRVWKYTTQFKREMELGLDVGIRNGLSADQMTKELRQYLQYPDKLFRRVRDEHGNLQLSKAAADFHPGQGVYRSSYKNARRLAATETNIAYRAADYERVQQLDFVVGIEVHLSNNHTTHNSKGQLVPLTDICDELAGKYPKDFKFTGWHPHCRCFTTTILKTQEELEADTEKILNGEPLDGESVNAVTDVPEEFKAWVADNEERIKNARSMPYFLSDNEACYKSILSASTQERNAMETFMEAVIEGKEEIKLKDILPLTLNEDEKLVIDTLAKYDVDWSKAKSQIIPVDRLCSVQGSVFTEVLNKYAITGEGAESTIKDAIQAVKYNGKFVIIDGNHRAVSALINEQKTIRAVVVDLDEAKVAKLLQAVKKDENALFEFIEKQQVGEKVATLKGIEDKGWGILVKDKRPDGKRGNIKVSISEGEAEWAKSVYSKLDLDALQKDIIQSLNAIGLKGEDAKFALEYYKHRDSISLLISHEKVDIRRAFARHGNGDLFVHHEFFKLDEAYQGKGFSKDILKAFLDQYEKIGVKEIRLDANINVGGYCWARYGFAAEKNEALAVLEWAANEGRPASAISEARKIIERFYKTANENIPFPMRLWADKKWGKSLLMNSNWSGVLNLEDKDMLDRFKRYLRK